MTLSRKSFLQALGALAGASAFPGWVQAGVALKMMIPANPGGGWDTTGRALGKAMQEAKLVDSVQYENKGGAAGALGIVQFHNSRRADPNALMVMGAVMLGGQIQNKPAVQLTQLTPIARLTTEYGVYVLPANSRFKSMKDVIEAMRKDPASVKWGGGSKGSTEHIAAAMIARDAGIDASKINYVAFAGGGEAVAAILGGNVDVGGSGYSEFQQYIESGKMKPIAVTSPTRLKGINIPTLKEQGIGVELGNWRGVYAPAGITAEQRQALTQLVVATTKTKQWQESLDKNSWTSAVLSGKDFENFVDESFASLRAIMIKSGML